MASTTSPVRLVEPKLIVRQTWPLVARELRAESRRAVIYWLRVLTASIAVAVFAGFVATTALGGSLLGAALFDVLDLTIRFAVWVIVPMMTADCISREKREGTPTPLPLSP